jgi:sugar phosphate isomerase/epimerase
LSFANGIPDLEYLEATCKLCAALNIPLIGGGGRAIQDDRDGVVKILQQYNIQYGFENHPEPSAEVILSIIGDDHQDLIGVALDTGWIGTQGGNLVEIARKLLSRIKYVHMKDVLSVGEHNTCKFGDGIVELQACVNFLEAVEYSGGYSVEHEPHSYDPTDEIVASTAMLRDWIG